MDLAEFFGIASKLKEVKRTGWVERGVKSPETSADHSLMVALMALVFGEGRKLDLDRTVKMALVHDLPEAIVGDIISRDKWKEGGQMEESEKIAKERAAMKKISGLLGDPDILGLWEEFESGKSPESRFVEEIDWLATIFQAVEYRKKGNFKKPLEGFWDEKALSHIKDRELRKFLETILKTLDEK